MSPYQAGSLFAVPFLPTLYYCGGRRVVSTSYNNHSDIVISFFEARSNPFLKMRTY